MAGVVLELDARDVRRALDALRRAVSDMQPLMAEIGEVLVSQTLESFEEGRAPDGSPWPPSERVLAHGGQTLMDTGQLRASLSREVEVLPDEVWVGSSKVYAAIHQLGGQAGRGHGVRIPARPFLPDEDTVDMDEVMAAIQAHFEEALR